MITGNHEKPQNFSIKTFSTTGGTQLTMDYYKAAGTGKRPCVIVIHGGSWAGGDSRQLPELNTHLALKGYQVVSLNYRLAPEYKSPAPVEDVNAALFYLKKNADELGIDTNNIVLLGRSAGAQIALVAAYTLPHPGIKGVISFYGPADMIWGYQHPNSPLIMNSCKVMEDYLGGSYAQLPEVYRQSSPVEWVTRATVPTLMLAGPNDPLVAYEHNLHLCDTLKKYNVPHYLLTLPWATHGFDYTLNGPGGQMSTYTIDRFLHYIFSL